MKTLLEKLYFTLWGPYTIIFILLVGVILTIKLKFVQIRFFVPAIFGTIKNMFQKRKKSGENGDISPFQALSTALAGTIGIGSLAGVGTAIFVGGPGTIFWMWVAGFFGMAIKFTEIFLCVMYRDKNNINTYFGGPMFYIKNGLKSEFLSVVFSISCLLSAFGMGNAVQSNSIAVVLYKTLGMKPQTTGVILSLLVGAIILGGIKKIASINEIIVPFMAIFYLSCCLIVLYVFRRNIVSSFVSIFSCAFGLKEVIGGVSGISLIKVISSGFSKGIFISEAGLGSSSIAHGATKETDPIKEGLFGIFEVFITSFFISTITALTILSSGIWEKEGLFGIELTLESFNGAIPNLGSFCITITTIFFSLSTILGWAYYGEVSLKFLSKKISINLFRFCFIFTIFLSAISEIRTIWYFSEIANALMLFPNLYSLIFLSKNVINELKNKKIGVK